MNPLNVAQSRVANKQPIQAALQLGLTGVRRLLGVAYGVNLNALSTDTAIPLNLVPEVAAGAAYYLIRGVQVNNASVPLTTAQGALYTAPGAGGDNIVAAASLSSLTTATSNLDHTIAAVGSNKVQTANTVYYRCTTAQGAPATADVYIWGEVLP
jgi:hypothetical protein